MSFIKNPLCMALCHVLAAVSISAAELPDKSCFVLETEFLEIMDNGMARCMAEGFEWTLDVGLAGAKLKTEDKKRIESKLAARKEMLVCGDITVSGADDPLLYSLEDAAAIFREREKREKDKEMRILIDLGKLKES